jgi:Ca2+-binding EF-hand superfamily protein
MSWCATVEAEIPTIDAPRECRQSERTPDKRIRGMASILVSTARLLTATAILLGASAALAQEPLTDQQSAEKYFDRLDQKKQGFFTLADIQRIEGKVFIRTDDNKDGQLTLSEYNYGIPDERQDVIDRFTKRFRLADADTNGRVTMEEYMQFCANVVAAADANKDGMVTKEEFVAATAGSGAE